MVLYRLSLAFLLSGCVADLAEPYPKLSVDKVLELPVCVVGETTHVNVLVTNVGFLDADVTLDGSGPFELSNQTLQISGNDFGSFWVHVTPVDYEDIHGEIYIRTNFQEDVVSLVGLVSKDGDNDGFLAQGAGGTDCNDQSGESFPGNPEFCDGLDNDCNGWVDDVLYPLPWYRDNDDDGFGSYQDHAVFGCGPPNGNFIDNRLDCDDTDSNVAPGVPEVWYDGVDQNCDHGSDFDQDGDGFDAYEYGGKDCDDLNARTYPGSNEGNGGKISDCSVPVDL